MSCNLLTGIVILARWQGKAWILSHLLPAARALISQESGDGKEVLVEEAPRQLLDMLTVSFGKASVRVKDVGDIIVNEFIHG